MSKCSLVNDGEALYPADGSPHVYKVNVLLIKGKDMVALPKGLSAVTGHTANHLPHNLSRRITTIHPHNLMQRSTSAAPF